MPIPPTILSFISYPYDDNSPSRLPYYSPHPTPPHPTTPPLNVHEAIDDTYLHALILSGLRYALLHPPTALPSLSLPASGEGNHHE